MSAAATANPAAAAASHGQRRLGFADTMAVATATLTLPEVLSRFRPFKSGIDWLAFQSQDAKHALVNSAEPRNPERIAVRREPHDRDKFDRQDVSGTVDLFAARPAPPERLTLQA